MPPQQQKQTPEEDRLLRTSQALVLLKDGGIIDREEARKKLNERHDWSLVLQSELKKAPPTVYVEEERIPVIPMYPLDGGLADLEESVALGMNHDQYEGDER